MKFSSIITALAAAASATASTVSVSYDTTYDSASGSLTTVACSDGANGLITKYAWIVPYRETPFADFHYQIWLEVIWSDPALPQHRRFFHNPQLERGDLWPMLCSYV